MVQRKEQALTNRLLYTRTSPELADPPSFVRFDRRYNVADNFHAHLADVLWWRPADADAKVDEAIDALGGDVKPDSLLATPDMLCVLLSVLPGAKREVWQLEEEIVLGKFAGTR